jgi:hypothetical protein
MKKRNKIILFFLVLILFLLLSFNSIESGEWNVKKIIQKENMEKGIDLDKLKKNLDLILSLEIKKTEMSWGRNPFQLPPGLRLEQAQQFAGKVSSSTSTMPINLQGVVINGKNAWAIIDEMQVKVGDSISGWVVEKIEMGKVVLRSGQKLEVLLVD